MTSLLSEAPSRIPNPDCRRHSSWQSASPVPESPVRPQHRRRRASAGRRRSPAPGRSRETTGPDVIVGSGGDDLIDGLEGDDFVCALGGNGGAGGDDSVDGGAGVDEILGDDLGVFATGTVSGHGGNDRLTGGPDPDAVSRRPARRPPLPGAACLDRCEHRTWTTMVRVDGGHQRRYLAPLRTVDQPARARRAPKVAWRTPRRLVSFGPGR
jgi:hypothetical protein